MAVVQLVTEIVSRVGAYRDWMTTKPTAVGLIVFSLCGVFFGLLTNLGHVGAVHGEQDVVADWLAVNALVDGVDPYTDMEQLAQRYDTYYVPARLSEVTGPMSIPRLPGSFVVTLPLVLFSAEAARYTTMILGVFAQGLATVVLAKAVELNRGVLSVLTACWVIGDATTWSVRFGTVSGFLMLLSASFLSMLVRRLDARAGIALAAMALLKAFPLLLILPLIVHRRWIVVRSAMATFLLLNSAILLLPSVEASSAITALSETPRNWLNLGANMSILGWVERFYDLSPVVKLSITGTLLASAGFVILSKRRPILVDLSLSAALALLISPLFWPHYVLWVLPFLFAGAWATTVPTRGPTLFAVSILGVPWVLTDWDPRLIITLTILVLIVLSSTYGTPGGSRLLVSERSRQ